MSERRAVTLSELQAQVRAALGERFPLPVWVSAEIAELKVNVSGHCYLDLVEKGENDTVPKAQARAVVWRSQFPRIDAAFRAETGQGLGVGMHVLAKVQIGYHELYGLSLQVSDIDPAYTLGDMERRRRQTVARLQAEGVWEMNRMLGLAAVVQRVAVVSSPTAAGYRDFCRELEKSPYRFDVALFEAVMQGSGAEESVVAALDRVAEAADGFDAVAIIRGGGSATDLNCFNAYRLCNHVAQFPLPVLTGIGHDKDVSVADMVAHRPLKTPTAVAAWLVGRIADYDARLEGCAVRMRDAVGTLAHAHRLRLERMADALGETSGRLLLSRRHALDTARLGLAERTEALLAGCRRRLDHAAELLLSHSAERVLRRGFVLVRGAEGSVVSAAGLHAGDEVILKFADGERRAVIHD